MENEIAAREQPAGGQRPGFEEAGERFGRERAKRGKREKEKKKEEKKGEKKENCEDLTIKTRQERDEPGESRA